MMEAQNEFLRGATPEFQQTKLEQLLKEKGIKKAQVVRVGQAVVVHMPSIILRNTFDSTQMIEQSLKEVGVTQASSIASGGMLNANPLMNDCFTIGMIPSESSQAIHYEKPKGVSVNKTANVMEANLTSASVFESRKHITTRVADMANYVFQEMGQANTHFETILTPFGHMVGIRLRRG